MEERKSEKESAVEYTLEMEQQFLLVEKSGRRIDKLNGSCEYISKVSCRIDSHLWCAFCAAQRFIFFFYLSSSLNVFGCC